jgi:RNA polymerase II subunit A small phosphatase-like protein
MIDRTRIKRCVYAEEMARPFLQDEVDSVNLSDSSEIAVDDSIESCDLNKNPSIHSGRFKSHLNAFYFHGNKSADPVLTRHRSEEGSRKRRRKGDYQKMVEKGEIRMREKGRHGDIECTDMEKSVSLELDVGSDTKSILPTELGSTTMQDKALLPESMDSKPTLVLDLDETLVFSSLRSSEHYDHMIRVNVNGFDSCVYVERRPHLDDFLEVLSKKYELVVFTASVSEYASKVVDAIDPNGYIRHRLYRDGCTAHQGYLVKNLSRLNRDMSKVLLLDNSFHVCSFEPRNCIPISSYRGGRSDNELLKLMNRLCFFASDDDLRVSGRVVLRNIPTPTFK